ncbi:hypothetical protein MANES_07G095300v8 [Manihot esculenta]|uniref:Uncharacterized protein n=1 Tax=Manihot esculenta TaxID=3983 RepID=A0A2C9VMC9_MANES|nr:hypothetical protein MANES_07G095300v8 [Manihot esculenta]
MSISPFVFLIFFFYSLLFLSPSVMMAGTNSIHPLVAAARPLALKSPKDFATFKPKTSHGNGEFRGKDVENCLPKGFHRTSAPSRYINYSTLGSTMCSTGNKHVDAP